MAPGLRKKVAIGFNFEAILHFDVPIHRNGRVQPTFLGNDCNSPWQFACFVPIPKKSRANEHPQEQLSLRVATPAVCLFQPPEAFASPRPGRKCPCVREVSFFTVASTWACHNTQDHAGLVLAT